MKSRAKESKLKLSAHEPMSLHAVAVYARRLMVLRIPEPRVIFVIRWIYVIDALRDDRASIVQSQRTQLVIRLRKKPF